MRMKELRRCCCRLFLRLAALAREMILHRGMLRVADAREIIDRLEMMLLQDVEDILRICMEFLC